METNKIIENNKLISEFMGIEPKDIGAHWQWSDGIFFSVREQSKNKALEAIYKYVKYHTSWDWLMPVIEKIENTTPHSVIISCGNCEIFDCEHQETKVFKEGVKILAVYNACIEFIKWFNENK